MGLHNYHQTANVFPFRMGGTPVRCNNTANCSRISGWVMLLPYLEQGPLYDQISNPAHLRYHELCRLGVRTRGTATTRLGAPRIPALLCPSDPAQRRRVNSGSIYCFCVGDTSQGINGATQPRGIFGYYSAWIRPGSPDGTSNTIALGERAVCLDQKSIMGGRANNIAVNANPSICFAQAVGGVYIGRRRLHRRAALGRWQRGLHGHQHRVSAEHAELPDRSLGWR